MLYPARAPQRRILRRLGRRHGRRGSSHRSTTVQRSLCERAASAATSSPSRCYQVGSVDRTALHRNIGGTCQFENVDSEPLSMGLWSQSQGTVVSSDWLQTGLYALRGRTEASFKLCYSRVRVKIWEIATYIKGEHVCEVGQRDDSVSSIRLRKVIMCVLWYCDLTQSTERLFMHGFINDTILTLAIDTHRPEAATASTPRSRAAPPVTIRTPLGPDTT